MDQTITIRNKKTGEVKQLSVSQARQMGFDDAFIMSKLENKAKLEAALQNPETIGQPMAKDESAPDRKLIGVAESGLTSLSSLQGILDPNPNQVGFEGKGELGKLLIPGGFGARQLRTDIENLTDVIGRLRTGAAVTTDEAKRFRALLPDWKDDEKTIQSKLEKLQVELSTAAKRDPEKFAAALVSSTPKEKNSKPLVEKALQGAGNVAGGALDFLFGSTKNAVQDVIQTPLASMRNQSNQNLLNQGIQLSREADAEKDPARKQMLLQEAQKVFQQTSGESQDISGGFSDSIQTNPLLRALGVGSELYGGATLATSLPSIFTSAKSGAGAIKNKATNFTVKGASNTRSAKAAATAVKFEGDKILKAGEKYIEDDPLAKATLGKVSTSLKDKTITAPQLLKKLGIWNKAYNSAGKVGKSSTAGLYQALADEARSQLAEKAPDVLQAQKALGAALSREKALRGIFSPFNIGRGIITGAATSTGLAALKKLGIY